MSNKKEIGGSRHPDRKALVDRTYTQAQLDEAVAQEQGRWQDAIRDKVITASQIPNADSWVDGGGCDSGDPLDVSLAEIGQVINYFVDQIAEDEAVT